MARLKLPPSLREKPLFLYYAPLPGDPYVLWDNDPITTGSEGLVSLEQRASLQGQLELEGIYPKLSWQEPWGASMPYTFKAVPQSEQDPAWQPHADTLLAAPNLFDPGHQLSVHAEKLFSIEQWDLDQAIDAPYFVLWARINGPIDALWIELHGENAAGRKVWGRDRLEAIGIEGKGTPKRRGGENLPSPHRWHPFIIHVSSVLDEPFNALGVGVLGRGGAGQVTLSHAAVSDQPLFGVQPDAVGLKSPHPYTVNGVAVKAPPWIDESKDISYSFARLDEQTIELRWYPPQGASPDYEVTLHFADGTFLDPLVLQGTSYPAIYRTEVYIAEEEIEDEQSAFTGSTYERFLMAAVSDAYAPLHILFKHYDEEGSLLHKADLYTKRGLEHSFLPFTLDLSPLA